MLATICECSWCGGERFSVEVSQRDAFVLDSEGGVVESDSSNRITGIICEGCGANPRDLTEEDMQAVHNEIARRAFGT